MAKKEETAVTESEVTVRSKRSGDSKQVIYLGPNNVALGLSKGTVYIDGAPAVVEQVKDTMPLLSLLFVPINRISEAEQELATEGSALDAAYQSVRKGAN